MRGMDVVCHATNFDLGAEKTANMGGTKVARFDDAEANVHDNLKSVIRCTILKF